MSSAYKIRRASNNRLYFVLEVDNKEILASEMYMKMESLNEGVISVRENSAKDERYIRKTSNTDKPYFVLMAVAKEPIGTGEFYSSQEAMEKGIESIKQNGPTAPVIDETKNE